MSCKVVELQNIAAKIKYPIGDGDHGAIKPAQYLKTGVPYIRVADMDWNGNISDENMVFISDEVNKLNPKSQLFPDDIIISKTGATIGKVCIVPSSYKVANTTASIGKVTIDKLVADVRYVFWAMKSPEFQKEMWKVSHKSAQPGFNVDDLKKFKIPLPALQHQNQIADTLDKAEALRMKDQVLLQHYDELAQSIFYDMFGNPVKNEKGWLKASFEELFDTRLGKMLDAKKQVGKAKYKYLGNSNVQWFRFKLENLGEMEFDEKELTTFSLRKGDLLICEGGEVGRAAIWDNEMENVYFQKAIHRARPKSKNITPEYIVMLLWFLANNGGFKDYVTTSTISHLTGEKLKMIPIPVPPYEKQVIYSKAISSINTQRLCLTKSIDKAESILNGLLQKVFNNSQEE